jgi:hypothetical protein
MRLAGATPAVPARYELKYVVPESLARAVSAFARCYCDPDPYLEAGRDEYVLTTLYLDSPDLHLYWDKKTLRWDRLKLRVRAYGDHAESTVFVELKRRYGEVVSKSRTVVPRERWRGLVDAPGAFDRASWPGGGGGVVEDFCLQCLRYRARAVVVLRYDREPLMGRFDSEIRVTFDRGIRFCRTGTPALPGAEGDYLPLLFNAGAWTEEPLVVLELKFTWAFPRWMQELVERFDLDRGSFSKYSRSLDQISWELHDYDPAELRSVLG